VFSFFDACCENACVKSGTTLPCLTDLHLFASELRESLPDAGSSDRGKEENEDVATRSGTTIRADADLRPHRHRQ